MLDEQLLREAAALSGERTLTRTIERALQEMIRRLKARDLLSLGGSGVWQGDLSAMRGDAADAKAGRAPSTDAHAYSPRALAGAAMRERPPVYRPRTKKPRSGR